MSKRIKKVEEHHSTPSYFDDMSVKIVRNGTSKEDKNFMMDDPRFTPEAMEKRARLNSLKIRRTSKKNILTKFSR